MALLEFRKVLRPALAFVAEVTLVLFPKSFVLGDRLIQLPGFVIAASAVPVIGRVVLVAKRAGLLRRLDLARLAQSKSGYVASVPSYAQSSEPHACPFEVDSSRCARRSDRWIDASLLPRLPLDRRGRVPLASTRRILLIFSNMLIASMLCACSSVGPATVERDRSDYGTAIGDSWKQQTLLNIVKLRYGDFPVFLEISQVIAGYQIQSTVGAGFNAGNSSGTTVGSFVVGGSVLAQGQYTDRPTVIYAPLTGTGFLKQLMTPIPPSALLFMLQSGYAADRIMPIMVNSINGVSNASARGVSRPADPKFIRLVQLLRDLQLADTVQVRTARPKGGAESAFIAVLPSKDPQLVAESEEIRGILHLRPGLQEFAVYYGGDLGKDNEISIMTRSMLQIMLELGAIVQVPVADVAAGKATLGVVDGQSSETQPPSLLKVASGDTAPKDAYVAVPYNGHWFWIANTDIRSKYTFGAVMLMFSISDAGPQTAAPVVTVPAN